MTPPRSEGKHCATGLGFVFLLALHRPYGGLGGWGAGGLGGWGAGGLGGWGAGGQSGQSLEVCGGGGEDVRSPLLRRSVHARDSEKTRHSRDIGKSCAAAPS
jgi:hypothetical protein